MTGHPALFPSKNSQENTVFTTLNSSSGDSFIQIRPDMAEKQLPQNYHGVDAELLCKHLKIFNLTAVNAIPMKPTTIVYLHKIFHLVKYCGVTHRMSEGVNETPFEMSQKIIFGFSLYEILDSLKVITKLKHYTALHYWQKFCTNMATF